MILKQLLRKGVCTSSPTVHASQSKKTVTTAVAHIRGEGQPIWWRCDDEAVSKLESGPAGNTADLGAAGESKKAPAQKKEPGAKV